MKRRRRKHLNSQFATEDIKGSLNEVWEQVEENKKNLEENRNKIKEPVTVKVTAVKLVKSVVLGTTSAIAGAAVLGEKAILAAIPTLFVGIRKLSLTFTFAGVGLALGAKLSKIIKDETDLISRASKLLSATLPGVKEAGQRIELREKALREKGYIKTLLGWAKFSPISEDGEISRWKGYLESFFEDEEPDISMLNF